MSGTRSRADLGNTASERIEEQSLDSGGFTRDETLEVLSNRRRRYVMHALKRREDGRMSVSDLAEQIAGWENDKDAELLTHQERKRVRNALRQFHLPKMDDIGFVEYETRRGTVRLSETAANTDFYVDSLTGRDIPWGMYYLGFSAVSAVCLVGLWLSVFPFRLLSPVTWGVFFVTALGVSSVCHVYDNYYRMRMGARDVPPEVGEQ